MAANNLVRALQAFTDKTIDDAERGISETAMLLNTEASSRAPVDEGNLKNSIQSEIGGLEATVMVGAFYGLFVEYGTGIVNVPLISNGKLKNRGKTGKIFNIYRMCTGIYTTGIV